jgi:hypothetical protein
MPNLDELRQLVIKAFAEPGVPDAEDCFEAILIREGFYVGRQFRCEGVRAVWLSDADMVRFFQDGKIVKWVRFETTTPELKRAAS